jgi:hypothetical protein
MTADEWNAKYPNSASPDPVLVRWYPDRERRPRLFVQAKTTSLAFVDRDGRTVIKIGSNKHPVPLANVEPIGGSRHG